MNKLKESSVELVAVSKTKPLAAILGLYEKGQRIFGENRVQELVEKQASLPKDIEWHMIGHLQRNKVKQIAAFVSLIHAVDSARLLKEIDKQGAAAGRVIPCLLQVHIAQETEKFGFSPSELQEMVESSIFNGLSNVRIYGLMGMATFSADETLLRSEFKGLAEIFQQLKNGAFADQPDFKHLSMGMSGDYELAIEEGSTMVRIGSLLFGARN